jgi:hypothetical protein
MATAIHVFSVVFDVVLAPFGHRWVAFDLLLWPVLGGLLALFVLKAVSNQAAIVKTKQQISMRLLEIRLFQHDLGQVLQSTAAILWKNTLYVGHNLLPMIVMTPGMLILITQLVANYAYEPSPSGATEVLLVELADDATVSPYDVKLTLPPGVELDAPPVRTADGEILWRLHATADGDHELALDVDGEQLTKIWSVGGGPRKVPVKRLQSLESFLYPGEAALPGSSAVHSIVVGKPHVRPLAFFPDGEGGILGWFFVMSLVAGFALKGVVGVTI